jgi:hypothetical protein
MCQSNSHCDAVNDGYAVLKVVHATSRDKERACQPCFKGDVHVELNVRAVKRHYASESQDEDSMPMCLSSSQDVDSMSMCQSNPNCDAVMMGPPGFHRVKERACQPC